MKEKRRRKERDGSSSMIVSIIYLSLSLYFVYQNWCLITDDVDRSNISGGGDAVDR
jgi:hypothetical protein